MPGTCAKLLDRFRTSQAVFRASRSELEAAGISGAVAQSIASGCTFEDAAAQREKMIHCGTVALTFGNALYPHQLREILDPPVLLFAGGRRELLKSITLAVVGTRKPTPYGLAVAERLSTDLAHAVLTIVNGMARGIDTAAHKGAGAGLAAPSLCWAALTSSILRRTGSWPRSSLARVSSSLNSP